MDSLIHNTGNTLGGIDTTRVTPFVRTPTTGKFTVEVNNVLQVEGVDYNISGTEITFTAAKTDSDVITALLHSEEKEYTFDITATDQANSEFSQRTFSMFVNEPGIAWIVPQREESTVDVAYKYYPVPTIRLQAATSNRTDGTFNEVTLTLTAGNLTGSGLTFLTDVSSPYSSTFYADRGVIEGGLDGDPASGLPASLEEDTEFEITVKAAEANNASYNNERTLTIKILQDPIYFSPAT